MNNKTKKILSIAFDALLVLLIIAILFVSISTIVSNEKGYVSFFGNVMYVSISDSMKGEESDSFDKHALLFSKELKTAEEKKDLKVGDVVTYWTIIGGQRALNTHRIIRIYDEGGNNQSYVTKGDNVIFEDSMIIYTEVVAKYTGKQIPGLGSFILFAQSTMGFFVLVMIPSLLILIYCGYLFYNSIKRIKDEKKKKQDEVEREKEKEMLIQKVRAEMEAELKKKTEEEKQKTD